MGRIASLTLVTALGVAGLVGCTKEKPARPIRTELRPLTGNTFELVPVDGSLPKSKGGELYCLVFTQANSGVVRQLTMTHENKSVHCVPDQPIEKVTFRIPVNEGPVKIHVFYSDQKLNASSIAQQLYENTNNPSFRPIDLRLPGTVIVDTLEYTPKHDDDGAPLTGGVVGSGGTVVEDAGMPRTQL